MATAVLAIQVADLDILSALAGSMRFTHCSAGRYAAVVRRLFTIDVKPTFAGKFLAQLLRFALAVLLAGQLRAKAHEVLQCVVAKRRAQAQKGYRDEKAWQVGRG